MAPAPNLASQSAPHWLWQTSYIKQIEAYNEAPKSRPLDDFARPCLKPGAKITHQRPLYAAVGTTSIRELH